MKDRKTENRKKKLRRKREWEARKLHRKQFPDFEFDEREANADFANLVKLAVRQFHFNEVSVGEQNAFRDMKNRGFVAVLRDLKAGMRLAQQVDPDNQDARIADIIFELKLGSVILAKIPQDELKKYLPVNDVRFLYFRKKIIVQFRSLIEVGEGKNPYYYSRRKPTIEVDGKRYIVAFRKHAVDGICNRISPYWTTYGGLGDAFSYLEECRYFERCLLLDNHPAFTFFDKCADERFWQHNYVKLVLGKENLNLSKGQPYYRVGYCPFDLIDGFIVARTLLFPGFSKTPEYGVLINSNLPDAEKSRLAELATESNARSLQESDDFSALRWFHDNGVPQVIQTNDLVYDLFGDGLPR
jgi:hypothetical protein